MPFAVLNMNQKYKSLYYNNFSIVAFMFPLITKQQTLDKDILRSPEMAIVF